MPITNRYPLQANANDTVGSVNGTPDGSVSFANSGPGGTLADAAVFAGTSNTPITLASTIQLLGNQAWSISFWAKQDVDSIQGMVLGDNTTVDSFVWLTSNPDFNGFRVNSVGATGDALFTVNSATRTQWSHYVITHDVSGPTPTISLYIDSVFSEDESAVGGWDLDITTIGSGFTGTLQVMDGQLADVAIFDSVATQTEIEGLFVDGGGILPPDYSVVDKVVLVLGQSNASGQFTNNQTYSHGSLYASKFESGIWSDLSDTSGTGSVWPLLATQWLADQDETVGFIYAAANGTGLVDEPEWADGGATYNAAIAAVTASGVTNVDLVAWFQGERDAVNDVTRAAYSAAMDDLITRLQSDLPGTPLLVCGQINNQPNTLPNTTDEIRNAQSDSWTNANISPGPVTYDIGPLADNLHFTTNAEAVTLADRWWAAVNEALFDGVDGTPPKVISAIVDGTTITLTYDRDLEVATNYLASAWTHPTVTVTAATKTGNRTVELTTDVAAASGTDLTLGSGDSAQGAEVPRGLATQPALPETVSLAAAPEPATSSVSRFSSSYRRRSQQITKLKTQLLR